MKRGVILVNMPFMIFKKKCSKPLLKHSAFMDSGDLNWIGMIVVTFDLMET